MSGDANNLWATRDRHIQDMIDAALDRYQPNLGQARGQLSETRYPTPTGNAPGGYTPALHASSHHSGGGDPIALGSLDGTLTDGQHGSRGGGSLHAAATTGAAGFMAAADKSKLDSLLALTTRGDLLTRDASAHVRLPIGASGRYLRSNGTDPSWAQLDMADAAAGQLAPARGGTGVDNGANLLTIPASGTAALRASAATAGRVGFWSDANSVSHDANLLWDAVNARLSVVGGLNLGLGTGAGSGQIVAVQSDSGTNDVTSSLQFERQSSGTPAAGFGVAMRFALQSSTTPNRVASRFDTLWATATDASRKARVLFQVADTSLREAIRIEGSGSAAMIGFLGAAASTRITVTGSRGGNAGLASLLTALAAFGLIIDSTTA